MKAVADLLAGVHDPALRSSLARLDAARNAGPGRDRPDDPSPAASSPAAIETPAVRSLRAARAARAAQDAAELVRLAKRAGLPGDVLAQVEDGARALVASNPATTWSFVMLSPAQNAAVVEWLAKHSKRPQAALRLWALLFTRMRSDTGEILLSRAEIAERLGIAPGHVSRLMTDLQSINAIRRESEGRRVRYFMSPSVATHIPSPAAREAARRAAGPLLAIMEGDEPSPCGTKP